MTFKSVSGLLLAIGVIGTSTAFASQVTEPDVVTFDFDRSIECISVSDYVQLNLSGSEQLLRAQASSDVWRNILEEHSNDSRREGNALKSAWKKLSSQEMSAVLEIYEICQIDKVDALLAKRKADMKKAAPVSNRPTVRTGNGDGSDG